MPKIPHVRTSGSSGRLDRQHQGRSLGRVSREGNLSPQDWDTLSISDSESHSEEPAPKNLQNATSRPPRAYQNLGTIEITTDEESDSLSDIKKTVDQLAKDNLETRRALQKVLNGMKSIQNEVQKSKTSLIETLQLEQPASVDKILLPSAQPYAGTKHYHRVRAYILPVLPGPVVYANKDRICYCPPKLGTPKRWQGIYEILATGITISPTF
ncbi:hypothetical protein HYPSUDRAFT_60011 [Hypholoma sublateritium FD-334 SS-4]|uniref:Uncharacterized protein n=1 Tax=Hypholoma sublateritium (strain FD-334 SS-4) TaxID=945553 RepID=A0A0D2N210_HYPSF|nr:hypothetical protein HYPSUDRAFT_60011 [Hypholoma sublateritium FD-334 SS-4]